MNVNLRSCLTVSLFLSFQSILFPFPLFVYFYKSFLFPAIKILSLNLCRVHKKLKLSFIIVALPNDHRNLLISWPRWVSLVCVFPAGVESTLERSQFRWDCTYCHGILLHQKRVWCGWVGEQRLACQEGHMSFMPSPWPSLSSCWVVGTEGAADVQYHWDT